ncbi:hypothetical protein J4E83_002112 [Alternaria metachromatica]|uniref:uncharacterized protein n=1 Tax=Alternaria metachromatica TaxID=283354 RepID=UPI0020C2A951|nr:uncharacterized protein J4E83_002112 [Alternaria metachromatica]XP_051326922.1 uncharacterized protein J4E85_004451 [Alternaria conjuncta]KAI4634790.1 hypothetical protein J4E83_002112 [Alternaria metachromatica]KAI4712101.1 hypothetical protein J4E89_003547 [Alternaria sp. Ai002NY15]KAI4929830.1 hypothetical protein J4E85_004451 [Alternaria conjuncta]
MSAFHFMARKRGRDDDSDSDFDEERYLKKSRPGSNEPTNHDQFQHQSLSTPPRLFTDIRSMTPAHSEYGGANSPDSIYGGPVCISRESSGMDMDMDMDDDDMDVRSQPPESPAFNSFGSNFMRPPMLQPSLFNSDAVNNNSRIPTPIHPTFKRGGMSGLGYPMSGSAGGIAMNNSNVPSMQAPPPAWKGQRQDVDEDRTRRMPSPISEDDDIPDTPTAFTQSQLSRLSFSHTSTADQMDTESSSTLAPPSTPRGRKRSGALTGMGRFSMGYREDCEKCRQRVPGHYSHFLP